MLGGCGSCLWGGGFCWGGGGVLEAQFSFRNFLGDFRSFGGSDLLNRSRYQLGLLLGFSWSFILAKGILPGVSMHRRFKCSVKQVLFGATVYEKSVRCSVSANSCFSKHEK